MSLVRRHPYRDLLREVGVGAINYGIKRTRAALAKRLSNQLQQVGTNVSDRVKRYFSPDRGRSSSVDSAVSSPAKVMRGRSMTRRGSRSRSRSTRRRSAYSSSSVTTNQHDIGSRYRRRSGRRGSGRGARRARYRIMQVVNANQPLSIWTDQVSVNGTTAVDALSAYGVGLFTTQMSGQTDLASIAIDAGYPALTTTNLGGKFVVKSACLDVQIKNNGTTDCIVDIYEILNVRDPGATSSVASLFSSMYAQMTTTTAASWNDVAVSVFENPMFCRHFKVLSKKETLIPASDIITMQMRYGKDRTISLSTIADYVSCVPKLSKFYFYMWHGAPSATAGTGSTPAIDSTSITISWQKAYKYALMSGRTLPTVHNS